MTSTAPISVPSHSPKSTSSSIEVAVDAHAPTAVRHQLDAALLADSVEVDVRADAELLVTELVSNVVRHEDASTIKIDVTVDGYGAVTVSVTGGAAEPAAALLHPPALPAQSRGSGRGLFILDSIASSWGTRRAGGRTTVWFTINDGDAPDRPDDSAHESAGPTDAPSTSAVLAMAVEAVAAAATAAAQLIAEPGSLAARAATTAEQAAVGAAATAADAAQRARTERATAATVAADAVADAAARAADAVQVQSEELASALAAASASVSNSIHPGFDEDAIRTAFRIAAKVISTAAITAEETGRSASLVARTVASTAAAVASTTAATAAQTDREVLDAAVAVQAVTAATARELAADTLERGAAVTMATREAVAASERLYTATRQLQRAGLHDRIVALALQEAMLTRLPDPDELQLAARYLTAAEEDQVGGDWYDALVLPDGTTALMIGDVIGHDIEAAAAMGQLRNILRALVWDRAETPAAVVTRLDHAIRDLRIDTIATLILAKVEPPSPDEPTSVATLRWSNAGHPGPVLVHADGTAIFLDPATDMLLGVQPMTARRDHCHPVPPGSTLLLYTDGLVENRTQSVADGQLRLLDAVRAHHHLEPGELIDAVLADLVSHRPADDVAVLAIRFQNTLRSTDSPDSPGRRARSKGWAAKRAGRQGN